MAITTNMVKLANMSNTVRPVYGRWCAGVQGLECRVIANMTNMTSY